jgi:hypothetical protein
MKRLLASVAVVAASLAFAGSTQAGGPGKGQGGNGGPGKGNGGNGNHSVQFKGHGVHGGHNGHGKGHGGHSGHFGSKGYHHNFGKSFSHGFFYPGKSHNHWSYQCYSPKYGCTCYWCPSTTCYYYWCEPKCCYYPISYVTFAPPVCAPPIQMQVQTQGPGQLAGPPVGVPPLPQ